eukprot:9176256-Pyramimonas_sp.AAC.1
MVNGEWCAHEGARRHLQRKSTPLPSLFAIALYCPCLPVVWLSLSREMYTISSAGLKSENLSAREATEASAPAPTSTTSTCAGGGVTVTHASRKRDIGVTPPQEVEASGARGSRPGTIWGYVCVTSSPAHQLWGYVCVTPTSKRARARA